MSSSVNYDDLYEEFVRLTSSPRPQILLLSSPTMAEASMDIIEMKQEITEVNESLDTSPLGVLTPPSPPSVAQPSTPQQGVVDTVFGQQQQYASQNSSGEGRPTAMETMCDSSSQLQTVSTPNEMVSATGSALVTTSPTIVASSMGSGQLATVPANTVLSSASAGQLTGSGGVKQLSTEGNPVPNANNNNLNHQSFLSGLLQTSIIQQAHQQQQQQQNQTHNLTQVHGHNGMGGNVGGMESHQHHQQQQQQPSQNNNMHHSMHSMQGGNACSAIQHQLMDNHHHVQPMSLQHQHAGHQMPHVPPHPSTLPHHQLPHHGHTPQQYMQFGMHLNGNGIGNGSTYPNHQMLPFHHHGSQITPDQQQPSQMMNMNLNSHLQNQSCFMQHAACMHFQQNSQPLSAQRVQGHVGWMTGPLPSVPSNQNYIQPTNHNNNNNNMASCAPTPTQNGATTKILAASAPQQAASLTDPASPGGLEILWREVPTDCQKLFRPVQDVPDTAKFRGYFTVCELLALKRTLEERYRGTPYVKPLLPTTPAQQVPLKKIAGGGVVKGEGRRGSKRRGNKNKDANKMALVSVPNGRANDNTGGQLRENGINKIATTNNAENPTNVRGNRNCQPFDCSGDNSENNNSMQNCETGGCCPPPTSIENRRYYGPPPPYRTATLVLKLLHIGGYNIRSFSTVNPNRLRVLFNTQRMMYECQLPIVYGTNSGLPSRKVLTVDFGFEQITGIRFGTDSLWMRIDGAPLLTIALNPAQEGSVDEAVSPHDQFLLDQIEKGQLKLSPIHQLYFLNERLVSLLESQLRMHPRFHHLIMTGNHY